MVKFHSLSGSSVLIGEVRGLGHQWFEALVVNHVSHRLDICRLSQAASHPPSSTPLESSGPVSTPCDGGLLDPAC